MRLRVPGAKVKLFWAVGMLLLLTAPTPGDVGGCGQARQELDEDAFFETKQGIDCERCGECRLETQRCVLACTTALVETEFPEGCVPLVHDGEVCLRRLLDASCDEYSGYMDDDAAKAPTECNFCPAREE